MKKLSLLFLLAFTVSCLPLCGVQAQKLSKKEHDELMLQTLNKKLEAKVFTIDVDRIDDANQQIRGLDVGYYGLTVEGDQVTANLPSSVGTNSGAYGSGGEPLKFVAKVMKYNVSENKKGTVKTVNLEVVNNKDKYTINIVMFKSGRCNLTVKEQAQRSISFEGAIRI